MAADGEKVVHIHSKIHNARSPIPFHAVPNGAVFRVLKGEHHFSDGWKKYHRVHNAKKDHFVKNDGTYVKISDSHAKNIITSEDAIFEGRTPCRIMPINLDPKSAVMQAEDWELVQRGKPT